MNSRSDWLRRVGGAERGPLPVAEGNPSGVYALRGSSPRLGVLTSVTTTMPVQPLPKEMEGEGDSATEMNGEEESEDERSASQSESEEESSEMNDEDYERRRAECVDEMLDLEKQFSEIKEKLFKERLNQVKAKLEDVMSGKAAEYLNPLAVLQNHMQIQIEVAGIYRGLCLEVIKHRYGCELQGAQQHLESEKLLLFDSLEERLLERIQRLEDDRHSVGLTSEWWDGKLRPKHSSKEWDSLWPSKRKKPPLVSGPYIVYMLHDIDIMEDWTAIKKAKAAVSPPKRKLEGPLKTDKLSSPPLFAAHCEDGHLHYEGEVYVKGESLYLQVGDETPVQAVITSISTGEVWLRREDASKTKIYVSQLQKGKYSVHKA